MQTQVLRLYRPSSLGTLERVSYQTQDHKSKGIFKGGILSVLGVGQENPLIPNGYYQPSFNV